MKPIVVFDLFSGMGGFTQGAIDAGASVALAVDLWGDSNRVHRDNHPQVKVLNIELGHRDHWRLFKRMVDEWRSKGYHVHIHGSPPCQALSNASNRDASEGMPLVIWYLEMVKKVKPDSWSMENVVPVRKRLPEGTPSVVLNSADFGVPQTRRRCFAGEGWLAEPTHLKDEWVSVLDALPYLKELIRPPSMKNHWSKDRNINTPFPTITSQSVNQIRVLMDSGRSSSKTSGVNPRTGKKEGGSGPLFRGIDEPSYTIMSSPRVLKLEALGSTRIVSRRRKKGEEPQSYSPTRPAHTITQVQHIIENISVPSLRDNTPQKIRSLTISETLVLQGFSPDYDLSSATTQKARWTMIGNAVPPPVAAAVIRGIQNDLFA